MSFTFIIELLKLTNFFTIFCKYFETYLYVLSSHSLTLEYERGNLYNSEILGVKSITESNTAKHIFAVTIRHAITSQGQPWKNNCTLAIFCDEEML